MHTPSDADIRTLLSGPRRFAVVGASLNPARPSNSVGHMLAARGHHVVGVNPGLGGKALFGHPVVARLEDLAPPVDVVDVFRRSTDVAGIVETILTEMPFVKVLWLQLGVRDPEAEARAQDAGLMVITDRCPSIEYRRLF